MTTPLTEREQELLAKIKKLQDFKDFVHKRLDEMGIPTHPGGKHSKEGCRIGDRLDIVQGMLSTDAPTLLDLLRRLRDNHPSGSISIGQRKSGMETLALWAEVDRVLEPPQPEEKMVPLSSLDDHLKLPRGTIHKILQESVAELAEHLRKVWFSRR